MSIYADRLNSFERRLRSLETELVELQRLAPTEPEPQPEEPAWTPFEGEPEPVPVAAPVLPPPVRTAEAPPPFDFSTLLGARALAWTGGVVTLLGIVFFFVLAVQNGWIGPGARVSLGALASALAFGGGIWLRGRYGDSYAAVSAVGAGIAGFYATLLAATALYELLPPAAALVAAAGIAAAGATVALVWDSETIAGLGLVGAILAPAAIAVQGGLTATGTGFAALVVAATTAVAVRRDWRKLHVVAVLASAPQIALLVLRDDPYALPLAIAFWLLYAGGATWLALRTRLSSVPASLLLFSAVFAGCSAAALYDGRSEGVALLVEATSYAAAGIVLYRNRDLASLLWAIALGVGAVAAADLTSGATLTIVWSAEASVLAWLARRIDEPRFQLAALGWFVLALVHGLGIDARPERLFVENPDPWRAAPSAVALAVAAGLIGLATWTWSRRTEGWLLQRALDDLRDSQRALRIGALSAASVLAVYAGSLGVVGLPSTWDWGHVAVAGLWSSVAAALVLTRFRVASLVAAAAAVGLVLGYDLRELSPDAWPWSFAAVAAGTLFVAVVFQLRSRAEELDVAAVGGVVASVALAAAAVVQLLDGKQEGAALLALAAAYGTLAAAILPRHRDLASTLGLAALVLAVPGSIELLDGTWLVLAWAGLAAALALAARAEERLELASLAYLTFALWHTLVFEAQPQNLFVAGRHPGGGVPALVFVLAGGLAFVALRERLREPLAWATGALGLYAASLAILQASESAGGTVDAAFQRGHTAVSALWGAIGLALLYAGLRRGGRALQLGGFALFGISLAKLFLFDLANLSSVTRALSFLAVGAVLLVAGFFYQRLAVDSRT